MKGRNRDNFLLPAVTLILSGFLTINVSAQQSSGVSDSSPSVPPVTGDVVTANSAEAITKATAKTSYQNTIGLYLQDVSGDFAWYMNLPETRGVAVRWVRPESDAAKAGLQKGDFIRRIEGIEVRNVTQASQLIFEGQDDGLVNFEYLRDGELYRDVAMTSSAAEIADHEVQDNEANKSLYYYADIDYGEISGDRFVEDPADFNSVAARREALIAREEYDGVDYGEEYNIDPDYSSYAKEKLREAEAKELTQGSERTIEELRAWVAANREYLERYHSYYGTPYYDNRGIGGTGGAYRYNNFTGVDPGDGIVDVNTVDQVAPPDDVGDDTPSF